MINQETTQKAVREIALMRNHTHRSAQRRQRGGTILGIIIGLVIGLAIALIVAVAITKTSLPFMNKVGKQETPELTPGQTADPNKSLYGNNGAAKDAAKDFAPANAAQPATPAVAPAASQPVPPQLAAAPAKPAATVAAATPAAAATAATAAVKPDSIDDKWVYYLQAGAFREQADAENSKAKLALAGFEATILDKSADSGPLYRVRLGPFNQLEAMNRVRGKLSDNGIDVAVVRIAK